MKSYKKGFDAFLEKANKIHNNKYTYVKESYIKSTENCTIICPIHGEFYKRPDAHTNQTQGCPLCSEKSRLNHHNLKWYLDDVNSLIKDKSFAYIPEKEFVFKKTKLKFYCDIHKEFTRTIRDIEEGKGCKGCDKTLRQEEQLLKNKNEFMTKAVNLHGDKYNYDTIDYKGAFEVIQIYCSTCKDHFPQKPREHLQGHGCQVCGSTFAHEKIRIDLKRFLERVKDKYDSIDYSQLQFNSITEIGTFICIKEGHGPYKQKISNHLRYKGCEACSREAVRKALTLTSEEFYSRVRYKDHYDYSKVKYKSLREEITLYCKRHNLEFPVTPYTLLYTPEDTEYCPKCRKNGKSLKEIEIVSFLENQGYKVIQTYKPSWLGRKELDIYLPDYNLALEYNGSITHHSNIVGYPFLDNRVKGITYHLDKYQTCLDNYVNLIHIFEFEDLYDWYDLIISYLNNPNKYIITFQNNKRLFDSRSLPDSKVVTLEYYGQSFIKPLDTK